MNTTSHRQARARIIAVSRRAPSLRRAADRRAAVHRFFDDVRSARDCRAAAKARAAYLPCPGHNID